ncbi:MAG: transposase [Bacteroidota bacterium]
MWQQVLAELVKERGIRQGRNPSPSRLILDSQSVKTANKGESRGFDGGKKIKGRKRQIIVDTQGNLHQVLVHGAKV